MKNTRLLFKHSCLLTFATLVFFISSCTSSPSKEKNLAAELTRQADAWDKAIVRKDLAAISANMADDFQQIRESGEVVDKAVFLRDITSEKIVIDPYTVEDFSIRIHGDVAMLSGSTRMTGSYAGNKFKTRYRYTDIYERRKGKWQISRVQITTIAE
ncbi:MAG: nuclear transport factor 2 family protein [Arenimonas sp.]